MIGQKINKMNTEIAIKTLLERIIGRLESSLNDQNYLFLTRKYSPFERYTIERKSLTVTWDERSELILSLIHI